ncbi:MAG TPA: DUF429 domain-containing protein [Candidatus Thermoplasmatota archaeon]|nr:DUF429 domain-containing protein [Candidatus Thermoplasmatota archaeon]
MRGAFGVDGCRGGWVAVCARGDALRAPVVAPAFSEVLQLARGAPAAVDMPIGLLDAPEDGGRACDREARRALGYPRSLSVFSPPSRAQLSFTAHMRSKLSAQTRNLVPKIVEVDAVIKPRLQRRVVEAHPELAFATLLGRPARHYKKTREGRNERLEALEAPFPRVGRWLEEHLPDARRRGAGVDDLLDAAALAELAARKPDRSRRFPERPPRDARGLRMEIWG